MKVGIIGAGNIAVKMAQTIAQIDGIDNYAVASRDLNKAVRFQEKFGFEKAYGDYEELLKDENVDLVYIATIHSTHYPIMLLCLQYGKPVLCEKIFTTSLKDTLDIYQKFEEKKLFIAEALWTSFLPSRQILQELLYKDKCIGNVEKMEACFKVLIKDVERVKRKDLGGGAIMDIGIYPISFVFRTLGFDYKSVEIHDLEVNEYGADLKETLVFAYDNGIKAICKADVTEQEDLQVTIIGTKGSVVVDSVNCPSQIVVYDQQDRMLQAIDCAPKLGEFEYQILACKEALEQGRMECAEWTHENSIAVSRLIDQVLRA